jgi:hypothetical protein
MVEEGVWFRCSTCAAHSTGQPTAITAAPLVASTPTASAASGIPTAVSIVGASEPGLNCPCAASFRLATVRVRGSYAVGAGLVGPGGANEVGGKLDTSNPTASRLRQARRTLRRMRRSVKKDENLSLIVSKPNSGSLRVRGNSTAPIKNGTCHFGKADGLLRLSSIKAIDFARVINFK